MRYIVKSKKEPRRGESGTITIWAVYDTKEKRLVTATCPIKEDAEKAANSLEFASMVRELKK